MLSESMLSVKRRLPAGFTLIEMLIALGIGAAIAVMAFAAVRGASDANDRVLAVTGEVDEIDRVWQTMARDLLHAVPRSWYNRSGVERVMGFCTDKSVPLEIGCPKAKWL